MTRQLYHPRAQPRGRVGGGAPADRERELVRALEESVKTSLEELFLPIPTHLAEIQVQLDAWIIPNPPFPPVRAKAISLPRG